MSCILLHDQQSTSELWYCPTMSFARSPACNDCGSTYMEVVTLVQIASGQKLNPNPLDWVNLGYNLVHTVCAQSWFCIQNWVRGIIGMLHIHVPCEAACFSIHWPVCVYTNKYIARAVYSMYGVDTCDEVRVHMCCVVTEIPWTRSRGPPSG